MEKIRQYQIFSRQHRIFSALESLASEGLWFCYCVSVISCKSGISDAWKTFPSPRAFVAFIFWFLILIFVDLFSLSHGLPLYNERVTCFEIFSKLGAGVLLGMGNPLLDISANVGQDILDKFGVKLDTAILAEEKHLPLYKLLVDQFPVQYIAGGATQNSMRVAQWMLKSMGKPDQVAFMGCVGNDDYGKQLEDCAGKDGVLVHYMKDEAAPTGTCAALIHGGERSLVANLAAANNFKPTHLETDKAKELVESAKFYYCAGFFLTVSVPSLLKVAQHAVDNDKVFCLNLSAPFIVDFFTDPLKQALEYADYLFSNESEAAAWGKKSGACGEDETNPDLKKIALYTANLPKKNPNRKRIVVFTQGSKSTIVAHDGVVTEYPVEVLTEDKLVDTNGAGDAFVGGFLSMLVQDKPIEECVKAGHYAATSIIQVSGTTLDKPCDYVV